MSGVTMDRVSASSNYFIVQVFDRERWCAVLQAKFHVPDLEKLRAILGPGADADPDLRHGYRLDDGELVALVAEFGVRFDPGQVDIRERDIDLFRLSHSTIPYLVHTGYELPLLLDGRKKLARMSECYPPMTFEGEDRFDHHVKEGTLHREEVLEAWEQPRGKYLGFRTVYYTPKGEEWRIPAMRLIWEAAGKSGGWNEYFERLEGMLFGYEDWQNDWWLNTGPRGGGFGGASLCCAVTAAEIAWIEAAGFRALPPIHESSLAVRFYDATAAAEMRAFMLEATGSVALLRFNLPGGYFSDFVNQLNQPGSGSWHVPGDRIPELNRKLLRPVEIVARRDDPV